MKIKGEYIQLNQLLKLLGWVNDGGMANDAIDQSMVKVDGVIETRRRNKIKPGMVVEYNDQKITIE